MVSIVKYLFEQSSVINPRGLRRPKDGRGKGIGMFRGLRGGRNTEAGTNEDDPGPGFGKGEGKGLGKYRRK
jgi:hypothetical protein